MAAPKDLGSLAALLGGLTITTYLHNYKLHFSEEWVSDLSQGIRSPELPPYLNGPSVHTLYLVGLKDAQ